MGVSSEEPSKCVTLNYRKGVHVTFANPHDTSLALLILKGGLEMNNMCETLEDINSVFLVFQSVVKCTITCEFQGFIFPSRNNGKSLVHSFLLFK